jgi:uncharacterized membrane protein YhaH (DUF805 family)
MRSLFSPSGQIKPQPFIFGAIAVYVAGAASHGLTVPDVMTHAGLWPFIGAQSVLIWLWFVLHAKRLHDAGRMAGPALGVALLYLLSIVLLTILGDAFFSTSGGLMGNAGANGALGLILILYIVQALAGSAQYDLAWAVVTVLVLIAVVPIVVALGFTAWTATRPSGEKSSPR